MIQIGAVACEITGVSTAQRAISSGCFLPMVAPAMQGGIAKAALRKSL